MKKGGFIMDCTWTTLSVPCDEPEHIIAWRCDKCGHTATLTLCTSCRNNWITMYPEMHCPKDAGTLSYKTILITTGETTTCQINPQ